MTWWMWVVVAAVLAVIEFSGPGFFVIFFAVGALCAALALALLPDLSLWAQLALFSVTAVASLLLFRRRFTRAFSHGGAGSHQDLLRDTATPLEDLAPGAVGRAELRGVPWKARNVGDVDLLKGQRCKVQAVDGLTLNLRAE